MAYGDPSHRNPGPPRPAPDPAPLLAAAQQHLARTGTSACVLRNPEDGMMVAVGASADALLALLARQLPHGQDGPRG